MPPWGTDAALVVVLLSGAVRCGAYAGLRDVLDDPLFRACLPILAAVLPALFSLTWLGYGATVEDTVRFYGLFPVDFANLAIIVSLVNASPGLPLAHLAGGGSIHYHWFYHTIPAWLGGFGGGHTPNPIALALSNLLAASLLLLALADVARRAVPRAPVRTAVLTAAIVSFAASVEYPYEFIASHAHISFLEIGPRNSLLLTIVNGMTAFGNNSIALILILYLPILLARWNEDSSVSALLAGALFLVMVLPYSATLFFVTAPVLAAWLVLGKVRRPLVAVAAVGVIGALGAAVLWRVGVLGDGSAKLSVAFDRGQFARNVLIAFSPLWAVSALALRDWRTHAFSWLFLGVSVTVPSLLYIPGTPSGLVDFSMKTASLIAASAAPVVAAGIEAAHRDGRLRPAAWFGAGLIGVAALCTLAYAGQFAVYRLRGDTSRALVLPAGYVRALEYVRDHSPPDAVLLDPYAMNVKPCIPTLLIGERRTYLPTPSVPGRGALPDPRVLEEREEDYRAWSAAGFLEDGSSKRLARGADFAILGAALPVDSRWEVVDREGRYVVARSRMRPEGREERP
jgi:hypothetical protein